MLVSVALGMMPGAYAQTFKALYDFTGKPGGWEPEGAPYFQDGVLYGTTLRGGNNGGGIIYRLAVGSGKFSTLHNFGRRVDGSQPEGNLIADSSGNFYGITTAGGTGASGTVFKFNLPAGGPLAFTVAGNFNPNDDNGGLLLNGPVALDSAGDIYGITLLGGTNNAGTAWELSAAGAWTPVHSFGGTGKGSNPVDGLINVDGNFYGVTSGGGTAGFGTVYEINPTEMIVRAIYNFAGGADGARPSGGLLADSKGNLFGVTMNGGSVSGRGPGTVYKIDLSTGAEKVLYVFSGTEIFPSGSLTLDPKGNLYGTTTFGGGSVYELSPAAKFTVLHSFNTGAPGAGTETGVTRDPHGNLYGVTRQMGNTGCTESKGCGQIFEITP